MGVVRAFAVAALLVGFVPGVGRSQEKKCNSFGCKIKDLAKKLDSATTPKVGQAGTPEGSGVDMSIPSGPPPALGGTGSTGAVRFQAISLVWKVIDDGTQLRVAPPPPAADARRQLLGCGPDRACVATADLRVLNLETFGQSLANDIPFTVDVTLENHGRKPTSATEGRICTNGSSYASKCNDGLSDVFVVPALQPGERITLRRTMTGRVGQYSYPSTHDIAVIVDPDESIADFSRENNSTVVKGVKFEAPEITIVQQRLPPAETTNRLFQPVHVVRVQNPSRSISTGEIPMQVGMSELYGGGCRTLYPEEPLTLPSLPPKAIVEFAIVFPRLFASCPRAASMMWS
jgi:hypothetical protein